MFCELHTRSAFSFLSSGSQPESLINRAADLGIPAVALLDRDTVAGAVRFHFAAREKGVKPIIGSEITMDDGSLLPLVPINLSGYQNLSRLITTIKLRNKKGEHFATRRDIEEHSAGLLCFTGGADGFIHKSIKDGRGQIDTAWLKYVFERRLYVELQRHHLRNEEAINQTLLGLAHKLHLPYFASNGAYYADHLDRELFDVFTCIKNHTTIYDAGKLLSENSERYLKSSAQMQDLFEELPEAVEVTGEIAARVDFSMDELAYSFPDYPVPAGQTMDAVLRARAEAGARERYRDKKQEIKDQVQGRLDKEFRIIKMKRLAGYFLVVADISDYCKHEKMLSQGRGSAANSVVCYALGITAVEPIENKLLFERFLSETYEQYPDIDIDLPSGDDREKVIQSVYKQYGERGAGMTANVISYRGKSAVREVGKTFGFDAASLGRLSKLISHYEKFKGEELNQRLKEEGFDPADDIRFRKFGELYNRILDFPRHLGQHSGGMVISLGRLDGIVPLEPASMAGRNIIQWDKDDCARLKIVKVDLLGLGMMAVLRDSITLIGEHHGRDLSLYKIPYDDAKVFEALQNADTVGMFQVESRAQIAFLPKSKPANFYDIVVQVAIIRPGPIVGNMLKSYIARRQGFEEVDYIDERLKPTLERTLGVPLFQEQLLKIAMDIADFSGGEAEELRRAMGFKRPDRRMDQIETNLRAGMTRNNVSEKTQDMIVKCVKAFANYGFPESHAYSFALLAYASAYFMVHYRACFMAAMFNNYPLGFYNAATLVKDAQRHGLHFIALDINRSQYEFTVEKVRTACVSGRPVSPASDAECEFRVRVGLNFVRGLRKEVAQAIVAERDGIHFPPTEKAAFLENQDPALSPSGTGAFFSSTGTLFVPEPELFRNRHLKFPCGYAAEDTRHSRAEKMDGLPEKHSFSARRENDPDNPESTIQNPKSEYTSVEDLIRRVPMINKREIRALSLAGALNFDGTVHRREALWQSELAIQPAGELFENVEGRMQNAEPKDSSFDIHHSSFLKRMEGLQLVETDLRKTGISIGKHPMAFIRDELTKRGVLSATQTRHVAKGQIVSAAGAVIIRQRPMTANKVVFITLEDETGHSNFVVMPDVFERFRAVINQNDYLVIKGRSEDGGIIKALYFQPIQTFTAEVVSHNFR